MGERLWKGRTLWLVVVLGVVLLYSFGIQPWHMRWGATLQPSGRRVSSSG